MILISFLSLKQLFLVPKERGLDATPAAWIRLCWIQQRDGVDAATKADVVEEL